MEKWVIPCNVKAFNIFEQFEKTNTVVFKRVGAMKKGDLAYIYLALPYSEIRFKCVVVDDAINEDKKKEHAYAIDRLSYSSINRYVELELVKEYEEGTLKLTELKKNGLGQVQRQARMDRKLGEYIDGIEEA